MTHRIKIALAILSTFVMAATANAQPIVVRNDVILKHIADDCRTNNLSLVHSMEVEFDYFRLFAAEGKGVTSEKMQELLEKMSVDWSNNRDSKRLVILSKTLPIPATRFPNCWLSGKLTQSGVNERMELATGLVPGAFHEKLDVSCFEGIVTRYVAESGQVSFFPGNSLALRHCSRTLFKFMNPDDISNLKVKSLDSQHVETVENRMSIDFDLKGKGMPSAITVMNRQKRGTFWGLFATNMPIQKSLEIRQMCFTEHVGKDKLGKPIKLTLPSLMVQINYRNGVVDGCEMYVVNRLQFNQAIPANAFRVPIPANTTVRLFKSSQQPEGDFDATFHSTTANADARALLPILENRVK